MTNQELGAVIGSAVVATITGVVGLLKAGGKERLEAALEKIVVAKVKETVAAEMAPIRQLLDVIRRQLDIEDPDKTPPERPIRRR